MKRLNIHGVNGGAAGARAIGVQAALDPTKVDVRAELVKLHGEVPSYGRVGVGTDAFIDAAGAPNILSEVLEGLKIAATPQSAKVMIQFEEAAT